MKVQAIIPAAGRGVRFGSAKQFQVLRGEPLLVYALKAFEDCPLVSGVCLVVPEQEIQQVQGIIQKHFLTKISKIIPGGRERQDSVKRGLEALPPCDIVVIHDGVRPFVTPPLIEKTILMALETGACITGLPVRETVKRVDSDRFVRETVDRGDLWGIQTPQAFRYEILEKAIRKAEGDRFQGTDESMLVERIGVRVRVIDGSPLNIKVTTPEDLKIAEAIHEGRNRV